MFFLNYQFLLNNVYTTFTYKPCSFFNINCVLTFLQLFKKFIFDTFSRISLSGYLNSESDHFPSLDIWKVITFRVYKLRKWKVVHYILLCPSNISRTVKAVQKFYVHFQSLASRKVTRKNHTFANNSAKSRPNSKMYVLGCESGA